MTTSFPPHKSLPSKTISPNFALQHITTYLDAAATTPHMLPNATLQPTGPVAQSGATSNLTIQHLQRVQAGLRGEWLAPVLDVEEDFTEEAAAGSGKKTVFEEDWQDLSEYQQEQTDVLGDGDNVTVNATMDVDEEDIQVEDGVKDKETRKREKKEREEKRKAEKAEKARQAARQ